MYKKLLTVALVLITVSTLSTVGYATGGNNTTSKQTTKVELQKKEIKIIEPEDKSIKSEGDIVLISVEGEAGTNVTIEVYCNSSISTKDELGSIDLIKDESYTLVSTENIEIGSMGSFAKEIELKKGLYKIVVIKKGGTLADADTKHILSIGNADVKKTLDKANGTTFSDAVKVLIGK